MSGLRESLGRFLEVDGVRTVAVIDIATGMVVRSAGEAGPDFPATAASVADEARAARGIAEGASATGDRPAGDLVEITTVTGSRLQVAQVLQPRPGQGLLLFVDVERDKTNIGLASRHVHELSPAVLA
jgi:hypothetical protein